jgi:hypothetical protein
VQVVFPARGGDGRLERAEADVLSVAGAKVLPVPYAQHGTHSISRVDE